MTAASLGSNMSPARSQLHDTGQGLASLSQHFLIYKLGVIYKASLSRWEK